LSPEAGISDFTILASTSTIPSLAFAREMRYPFAAFSRLPMKTQDKLRNISA